MKKVVVLTDFSLLAQGIISRLRKASNTLKVEAIDFRQTDVIDEIIKIQPHVVIFGSKDIKLTNCCPLERLFNELPHLMVIDINLENSNIQLIRCDQHYATDYKSLLQMLENVNENNSEILANI